MRTKATVAPPPIIPPPIKVKQTLPPQPEPKKKILATGKAIITQVRPKYWRLRSGVNASSLDIRLTSVASSMSMPNLRVRPGMKIKIIILNDESEVSADATNN